MKRIFIAASEQHVGKTTSTLGLVANLSNKGYESGYCKPVGQQYLNIEGTIADKDAVLFSRFIGFDINPDWHSPVIIAKGSTKRYLDNPDNYQLKEKIVKAADYLSAHNDLVVFEGTGHPGVGSVVDLSNAQVARLIRAGVIMVVEGGIGKTIDRLTMSLALFREEKVPILGVIVNKVIPEKMEEVEYYLSKKFKSMGVPLLGLLPYDQTLSFPVMATINQAVNGNVILNEHMLNNKVEDIIAGSLVNIREFSSFQNILLVVSSKRLDEAIEKIQAISEIKNLERSPLSGVIVTGDGQHINAYRESDIGNSYFQEHEIPIITTMLDTYGSVVKISRIEVKINSRTPWKIQRAIELTRSHIDFDLLLEKLEIAV